MGFRKNVAFTAVAAKKCMFETPKIRDKNWRCSRDIFVAPAVVKQYFLIDPNGITRHKCEIL